MFAGKNTIKFYNILLKNFFDYFKVKKELFCFTIKKRCDFSESIHLQKAFLWCGAS